MQLNLFQGAKLRPLVVIESPYNAPTPEGVQDNVDYAKRCMIDCLNRGENPYASHLLFTQVLDDKDDYQRRLGIEAGLAWGAQATIVAVYTDRGFSQGMAQGIERAKDRGAYIEYRTIGDNT